MKESIYAVGAKVKKPATEEKEGINEQVGRVEQEARMVLPGIQALFGFQLIAVFNSIFFEHLEFPERVVHLAAILCTAFATLLILTPAAYHRQTEQGKATSRFVILASRLMWASMIFLATSLSLDIQLISKIVLENGRIATLISGISFLLFVFAWFLFPYLAHCRNRDRFT